MVPQRGQGDHDLDPKRNVLGNRVEIALALLEGSRAGLVGEKALALFFVADCAPTVTPRFPR